MYELEPRKWLQELMWVFLPIFFSGRAYFSFVFLNIKNNSTILFSF